MTNISKKVIDKQEALGQDEAKRLNEEMLTRCVGVAKLIAKLIVDEDLQMGDIDGAKYDQQGKLDMGSKLPEKYYEIAAKVQQAMLDANILFIERKLVFMLLRQPYDILQNLVTSGLEKTWDDGLNRILGSLVGKDEFSHSDFTLKQMDELLKQYPPKAKE